MRTFSSIGKQRDLPKPHYVDMVDGSSLEIDIKDFYKRPSRDKMDRFESLDLDDYVEGIKYYVFSEFDFDEFDYECGEYGENCEEFNNYKMGSMIESFEKKIINYVKSELRKVN